MRVAITYHYSLAFGGSERVLEVLAKMYPEADFFALMADPQFVPKSLAGRKLTTSFLDRLPGAKRVYRHLLPLYPVAVESLDLSGYGLVISADGAATKGVLTDQHALHLCYCHSPSRSFWDQYMECKRSMSRVSRLLFAPVSQYMRLWDFAAAQRIDGFIANSRYVAERIWKYYRRPSTVIHPPVHTESAYIGEHFDDYYLSVGRLVPGKRVDILIAACNRLQRRLKIAGAGPEEQSLRAQAGPTIEFLGRVEDSELGRIYASSRALLFAADEDFGIVPLEAQAYGRPVVAYGRGGSLETVVGLDAASDSFQSVENGLAPTGIFFAQQTDASLSAAIRKFEAIEGVFDPVAIQRHAQSFDTDVFIGKMRDYVERMLERHPRSRFGQVQSVADSSLREDAEIRV